MSRLGDNERSTAIELISEINTFINRLDINIKKAGGENTVFNRNSNEENSSRRVMFPDVLLYSDKSKSNLIQGWEIKMPDVPIHDADFVKDAQEKADALGLESTVLWNFQYVVLYVKNNNVWEVYDTWDDMRYLETRRDVQSNPTVWKSFLHDFILELSEFISNGVITRKPLSIVSENITSSIVNDNKELIASELKNESRRDRKIEAHINDWWEGAKEEFLQDETDSFVAYSKIIILSWINRIIFAHVIKPYHQVANNIENLQYLDEYKNEISHSPSETNEIFQQITDTSDFYTIFKSTEFDTLLPDYTWRQIIDFNIFFSDKVISTELIQDLLEGTVSRSKRILNGQFTTPEKLAKLLVKTSIIDTTGYILDPCVATGTIPKEAIKLVASRSDLSNAHNQIWASDKQKFVLQFANLSMTSVESIDLINNLFDSNVFDLELGSKYVFTNPRDGSDVYKNLPGFDTIVSNLPFIRQEILSDDEDISINSIKEEVEENTNIKLDGKSDYYCYIIFYLHKLLNKNGRLGVITSNSWLGTDWGTKFYEALKYYYNIDTVISSGDGRWFQNADVCTTILILTKKNIINEPDNSNEVSFVLLNKKLGDYNTDEINNISNNILLHRESDNYKLNNYNYSQIDEHITKGITIESFFYDVNWFNDISDKLIPLTDVFNIMRGRRRGKNEMFYPRGDHEIEEEYLVPMIKDSREINNYNHTAQAVAFSTTKTIAEMETAGHDGVLNWINKFKHRTHSSGEIYPERLGRSPNARQGEEWYQMFQGNSVADFGTGMNPNKRIFWAKFDEPTFIDQRIIGISVKDEYTDIIDKNLLLALLNSIVSIAVLESTGFNKGLGSLDTSKRKIENSYMLNPNLLTDEQQGNIIQKFNNMGSEIPNDTLESLSTQEREEFDHYILNCYEIDQYYDDIKTYFSNKITVRHSVLN